MARSSIISIDLVFPAEPILHKSRGIDRTELLPTRNYETPSGRWHTSDRRLIRLLHNDYEYVIGELAGLHPDTEFAMVSTNYGSNPYYCFWRQRAGVKEGQLFHLEQEDLCELHSSIVVQADSNGTRLKAAQVRFDSNCSEVVDARGRVLSEATLVLAGPAIVWDGTFVGWPRYTRETYDCRHSVALQYVDAAREPNEFETRRAEIQRLESLWGNRDEFVDQVLSRAGEIGFAEYERVIVGVVGDGDDCGLLLACVRGTAADAAGRLLADYPALRVGLQIAEGGATGIVLGTPADWRVVGASNYRRGRILCGLVVELKTKASGRAPLGRA